MKVDHYLTRLQEDKQFKSFKKKNPRAYLCAGFFILDYEQGKHQHQIDYLLPNGRIATFTLDDGVKVKISEEKIEKEKKLKEIKQESKLDLDMLKGIVQDEMKNHVVTEDIKKIVAVLQILDNKLVWNLTCILAGLGILQVHINDFDGNILKFEKHSILEFVKKV